MVEIEFDDDDFDDLDGRLERWGQRIFEELDAGIASLGDMIRQRLEEATREQWPGGTGLTAASWTVISLGLGQFYITNSNQPTIDFLTQGTTAHWIFPTTAKALSWIDEGGVRRFSMGHEVRGIIGFDIETLVMEEFDPILEGLVDAAVDAADREVGFE